MKLYLTFLFCFIGSLVLAQPVLISKISEKPVFLATQTLQNTKIQANLASFTQNLVYEATTTFAIKNDLPIASVCYFYIGTDDIFKFSSIDMVRANAGLCGVAALEVLETQQIFYNGYLTPLTLRQYPANLQVLHINIKPNQTYNLRLHTFNLIKKPPFPIKAMTSDSFVPIQQNFVKQTNTSVFISNLFLGAILIMAIFVLAIYSQNHIHDFGLYALYLITMLLFGILDIYPLHFKDFWGWNFPKYFIHSKESSVYLYLIFYHTFISFFITAKTNQKNLYKGFLAINALYLVLLIINLTILFLFYDLALIRTINLVNTFVFYGSIVFYVYIFVVLWKLKNIPFSRYIFWGSFVFYLSNVVAIYLNITTKGVYPYQIYPNSFIQLGAIIEILFFAVALGRKALMDSEEKNKLQKQVIVQLNEKKELIESINQRLEKEVAEKAEEIIAQTQNLQEEKQEKMRIQFQNKLQEMRLYAIQTQLNPHFLFNCLNTIKSLVINQENQKAAIYLNQFAILMRSTLENSEKLKINLKKSIEYLKNYVEMEKLRFKEDFDFDITYQGQEDAELLQVPPMLIQPFIENAIIHGLVPCQTTKMLRIEFVEQESFLICNVIDNGVGFDTKSQNISHNSKGLQMIQTYFDLWNVQKNQKAYFSIVSQPNIGTHVFIQIPI